MKMKQDFVTNSSSTSFVISSKMKIEELKENTPLYDLINSVISLQVISTIKGLDWIIDNYGFGNDDEDCIKMIEVINDGGTIIYMDIPYGGEVGNIERFLEKYKGEIIIGD